MKNLRTKIWSPLLLLAVLGVLAFSLAGCGQQKATEKGQGDKAATTPSHISIGTGGTGGVYYPLGGGMAELINKYVPGLNATAEVTGASIENCRRTGTNEMQLSISNADTLFYAYNGTPPFEKPIPNLRKLASLYPSTMQIVTLKKTGINSIADLKDKKVSVGPPGGATRVMAENIFTEYGIMGQVKEQNLSFTESVDAMKDGNLDATFVLAGVPASSVIDLSTTQEVVFVPIEPEKLKSLTTKFKYYASVAVPANTYKGQTADVPTLGVMNDLLTNAELSEDTVYKIMGAIFDHLDYLTSIHTIASQIDVKKAADAAIPLHPGAIKYYKEKGVLK